MKNNELEVVLIDAKNDNEKATCEILDRYSKMIHAYSFINGKIEEDLKQDLTYEAIKSIKKFKI